MSRFHVQDAKRRLKEIRARIFQQDPMVARTHSGAGLVELRLPGEACLGPGPTSSRVAVVDYNADMDKVLAPASVKAGSDGFAVGPGKPEDNARFHQVNVWAIITRTLDLLEDEQLFGRRIPWAFQGGRLRVLPHAGYWENAYYDRGTGALHFFYFEAPNGETVYTCLSHDIVTHELGHAVLDGLKPYYNELCSPDTAGFHEYFGDAIAMFSSLSMRRIVALVVGWEDVDLRGQNLVNSIAQQFGAAMNPETYGSLARDYQSLRTATNRKRLGDLKKAGNFEEHDYSEVLTGAYYDLLVRAYESMLKVKRAARGPDRSDNQTRVAALIDAAQLTGRMLLRALDYCPPVDLDYLDYARAVIRADEVAYPLDPAGFREHARQVFLERQIATSVDQFSGSRELRNSQLRNLNVDALSASPTDAYDFLNDNRQPLAIPPQVNFTVTNVYRTRKVSGAGFRPPQEIIVEFVWSADVPLAGDRFGSLEGRTATLWCGGTLVFSRDGNVLHYVLKDDCPGRREQLLDYMAYLVREQYITVDDGEQGLGARGLGANRVTARLSGGRLSLHRSASFRHAGR